MCVATVFNDNAVRSPLLHMRQGQFRRASPLTLALANSLSNSFLSLAPSRLGSVNGIGPAGPCRGILPQTSLQSQTKRKSFERQHIFHAPALQFITLHNRVQRLHVSGTTTKRTRSTMRRFTRKSNDNKGKQFRRKNCGKYRTTTRHMSQANGGEQEGLYGITLKTRSNESPTLVTPTSESV
ncbi:hypothetical protein M758_UG252200 [Ceratodon purpureus]|nr:hypothetical protein M758_UG252200 [Ceratodon purpureus]